MTPAGTVGSLRRLALRYSGRRHTGRPCAGPGVPKIRPHDLLQADGPGVMRERIDQGTTPARHDLRHPPF
jgi:hypothetical protein